MHQSQTSLSQEQTHTPEIRQMLDKKASSGGDGGGVTNAVWRGQMRDMYLKKCASIQLSGSFTTWSRAMKDPLLMARPCMQAASRGAREQFVQGG